MIKEIAPDLIPGANAKGKPSQRDQLRIDLAEAVASTADAFELFGECYNMKYLPQYAADESRRLWRKTEREICDALKSALAEEKPNETPADIHSAVNIASCGRGRDFSDEYIRVRKRTLDDGIHVYIVIDRTLPDRFAKTLRVRAIKALEDNKKEGAKT